MLGAMCAGMLSAQTGAKVGAKVPDSYSFEQGKLRVLILSGRNNHEWRESTPFLRKILEASGRFDVRVTEEPSALNEATLRPYDVLVSDYCGPRWSAQAEHAVEQFVSNGGGLVVVHAASYAFGDLQVLGEHQHPTGVKEPAWDVWASMVGARWVEGPPKTGHGKRHVYEVEWTNRSHPIAANLAPSFTVSDELYHNFRLQPGIEVLARAMDAKETDGTGNAEPLLWTNAYGRGRVFHTALGHDVAAMNAPGFVVSFARGIEWAATEKVTLPAAISLDPKNANALRVLLVTGGHDHELSFYATLDHQPGFRVNVDPYPAALRGDLVRGYDVLVLYDYIPDGLSAKQQENLMAFLNAGKGVVVLHHAVADSLGWETWWRDVVGAKYLLKEELGMKPSTYLHGQDVTVVPVGHHPVVEGLPPMTIHDETYKGMWYAPGLDVLLKTDNPTSDGPLAWICPWKQSRVIYIQLGHGREAHENPWYRELVRRAILWSGGR